MQKSQPEFTRFLGFFIFIIVVHGGSLFYFYKSFSRRGELSKKNRNRLMLSLFVYFLAVFTSFFATRFLKISPFNAGFQTYYWLVYCTFGFIGCLILYSLAFDVGVSIEKLFGWMHLRIKKKYEINQERRKFIYKAGNASIFTIAATTSGVGLGTAMSGPQLEQIKVPIFKKEAEALKGLKIIQISDLHVGAMIQKEYVENVVQLVNQTNPDLIFITGDSVDGKVSDLWPHIEPVKKLQSKYGVFGCTGNHEFYSGVYPWLEAFESLGITMLKNENRVLNIHGVNVMIAGVHDRSAPRTNPEIISDPFLAIKTTVDPIAYKIVLAHQPKSCFECSEAGFDIQFAGHTHAGQFFPFSLLVYFAHPYVKGLHLHDSKMWIYVNKGTGFWGPPNRFAVPAELTLVEFV